MLLRLPQILAALLRRQALAREDLDITAKAPHAESTAPSPPIDVPADDPAASVIQRIRDAAAAAIEKINSDEVSLCCSGCVPCRTDQGLPGLYPACCYDRMCAYFLNASDKHYMCIVLLCFFLVCMQALSMPDALELCQEAGHLLSSLMHALHSKK